MESLSGVDTRGGFPVCFWYQEERRGRSGEGDMTSTTRSVSQVRVGDVLQWNETGETFIVESVVMQSDVWGEWYHLAYRYVDGAGSFSTTLSTDTTFRAVTLDTCERCEEQH